MTQTNQHPDSNRDSLDSALDTALARYAEIEPRAGLEDRILASVPAQPDRRGAPAWRWTAVALATAVVILAVALMMRNSRPHHDAEKRNAAPASQVGPTTAHAPQAGTISPSGIEFAAHGKTHKVRPSEPPVSAANKLAQFPSPEPLSEQEKLLAEYAAQFHNESVLVARIRAQEVQREQLEYMQGLRSADSEESSNQTSTE